MPKQRQNLIPVTNIESGTAFQRTNGFNIITYNFMHRLMMFGFELQSCAMRIYASNNMISTRTQIFDISTLGFIYYQYLKFHESKILVMISRHTQTQGESELYRLKLLLTQMHSSFVSFISLFLSNIAVGLDALTITIIGRDLFGTDYDIIVKLLAVTSIHLSLNCIRFMYTSFTKRNEVANYNTNGNNTSSNPGIAKDINSSEHECDVHLCLAIYKSLLLRACVRCRKSNISKNKMNDILTAVLFFVTAWSLLLFRACCLQYAVYTI